MFLEDSAARASTHRCRRLGHPGETRRLSPAVGATLQGASSVGRPRAAPAGCAAPPASSGAVRAGEHRPAEPPLRAPHGHRGRSAPRGGKNSGARPGGRRGCSWPAEGRSGSGRGRRAWPGRTAAPGPLPYSRHSRRSPPLPTAATGDAAHSARGACRACRAPSEGPRAKLGEPLPQQRGLRAGSGSAGGAQAPPGCPDRAGGRAPRLGRLRHVEAWGRRPAQGSGRGPGRVPANPRGGCCLLRHPAHLPELPGPSCLEQRAASVPVRGAVARHSLPAAGLAVGQPCEWGAGEFPLGWDRAFCMAVLL